MAKKMYVGVGGKARKAKKLYVGIGGTARKIKKVYIGVNGVAQQCFSNGMKFTYSGRYSLEGNLEENWTLRLWDDGWLEFQSLPTDVEIWMNGAGGGSGNNYNGGGGGGYVVSTVKKLNEGERYWIHIGKGRYQEDGEATTAFGLTAAGGKKGKRFDGGAGESGGGCIGEFNGGAYGAVGGSNGSNGGGRGGGKGSGRSTKEFGTGTALSAGGGGMSTENAGDGTLPYVSCYGGSVGGGNGGYGGDDNYGNVEYDGENGAANTGSGGGASNTTGGSGRVSIRNVR